MRVRINLKIFLFVAIFLLTKQIELYGILMFFAFIHEMGHFLAGILLGLKPETLNIMPFGLSISFKTNINDYNCKIKKGNKISLKKILIALAGPLTNLIIIIICYLLHIQNETIIYANILIMLFNIIPIYPLDGGRITKEIITILCGIKTSYIYIHNISKISICIITAITSVIIVYCHNLALLLVIIYLWCIYIKEEKILNRKQKLYQAIEKA